MLKHVFVAYTDGYCENNGTQGASFGGSFALFDLGQRETNELFFAGGGDVHEEITSSNLQPVKFVSRLAFETNSDYPAATNNAAEARILEYALNWLITNYILQEDAKVYVFMDSDLIRKQILGAYKAKHPVLAKFVQRINLLKKRFNTVNNESFESLVELKRISGDRMKMTIIQH